jgi:hypothetical protein
MVTAPCRPFTPRLVFGLIFASVGAAACSQSSPFAATSQLQLSGSGYFVKLNASSSACSAAAPAVGFGFAPPLPLTRRGSGATMTLRDADDTFELTGTLVGDRMSFSMSASQFSPNQTATASGTGTAIVRDGYISGTFSGDFDLFPGPFTRSAFRCRASDHIILLTRAQG